MSEFSRILVSTQRFPTDKDTAMLLLSRLVTALVIFVALFAVIYFCTCLVGGGIAGAMVGMANPHAPNVNELGQQAGHKFVVDHLAVITLSSFGVSSVLALVLSFSGILPWCRKPVVPSNI